MVTLGSVLGLSIVIIGLALMLAKTNFIAGTSTLPQIKRTKRNLDNEKRKLTILKIGIVLIII